MIGEHSRDYARFITASPSSYHAAAEVARRLEAAGYRRQNETEAWDASPGGHVVVRDGAVMAWWVPENITDLRFAIVGAHTDSPTFKVKPVLTSQRSGYTSVNVETYGGLLPNSWLNRDLGIAGRLIAAGREHLVRTGAIMVIPQLAIHLDREASKGVELGRQQHLQPLLATGERALMADLAALAEIDEDDIEGFDLVAYDLDEPAHVGPDDEFFASGRQDNLLSVHAGLTAFESLKANNGAVAVLACFDHEEIGSGTATGARGPLLETVLRRTAAALGAGGEDDLQRAFARSSCVSADCGHAIHPNYPEKHDPDHTPLLGKGPLIKYNANQAYTTDGRGVALWKAACREAGVPVQDFVSRNDVPCGSTIGPLTATRLGIHTVDVGAPLLSMHSARELSHVADIRAMASALATYIATF